LLLLAALGGCGAERGQELPPQQWRDVEVRIESRPSPLGTGTAEILVMATDRRGKPAYNLVVSVRTGDTEPWKQAIEDGQVGVYRRAVSIEAGVNPVLQVQIRRQGEEGVLSFPLKPQP